MRSEVTIDLGAVRRNVRALARDLGETELWAVVKANGYGHGAEDCAGAAVGSGATGLCVATVAEGLALRPEFPGVRIVVFGPAANREIGRARDAGLELCVSSDEIPEDVPVHVKLDTGMGRWGASELPSPTREVIGVMTHLATADTDLDFAREQLARFSEATEPVAHLLRHAANSAATLRLPEARFDAVRCGIAIYGISPFGGDPLEDGLAPALSWTSELSLVKQLQPGQSAGYGRRFVAQAPTWIGIVPVGYGDGFRRDLEGTQVRVAGELRPVVGAVSMDSFAVELDREYPPGTPVTIVGPGLTLEAHAQHAGTIAYELACGIDSSPLRARRVLLDG